MTDKFALLTIALLACSVTPLLAGEEAAPIVADEIISEHAEGALVEGAAEEAVADEGVADEDDGPTGIENLTREELVEEITKRLKYDDEVLNFIPNIRKDIDAEGNIYYKYTSSYGEDKDLDMVNTGVLRNLLKRIISEMNRLNNERIMKQLRRIEQMQQADRMPPQPPRVVEPPKVHIPPPQPPTVYTPPVSQPAPPTQPEANRR